MLIILLQVQAQTSNSDSSSNAGIILSWVSIAVTILLGGFAIYQSFHYYKMSNRTSSEITRMLGEMKTEVGRAEKAATKVETISQILNDKFFALFEKTMTQLTKGALSPKKNGLSTDDMKKDLQKTMTDGSEKIHGEIKGLTDSMDKSHTHMNEIKSSLKVVADVIQDMFNKAIEHIDDYQDGEDEFEYVKKKVSEKCMEKPASVKEILTHTSEKIPLTKRLGYIQKLKADNFVNYEGVELYNNTQVFMENKLDIKS